MSARFSRLLGACAAAFALACATAIYAAKPEWAGGSGNANDNNWKDESGNPTSAPGNSDHAKISNGKVTVNIPTQFLTLEFIGGTLDGTGSLTLTQSGSSWTGGEVDTATLSLAGGTIGTGAAKSIKNGGKISLGGTTTWSGDAIGIDSSTLENRSGGIFDNTFDGTIANSGTGTFKNFGAFKKTGGTGITEIQANFESTGTIEVEDSNGTIKLSGGGSSSGAGNAVTVGTGAKLRIESQAFTFDGTGFDGAGTIELGGATTTFKGAHGSGKVSLNGGNAAFDSSQSTLTSLELVSGTLSTDTNGSASVGSLAWKGGSLNGKVSAAGGSLTTGNKTIAGGDLTLTGNTAWDGSGIAASASAKIKTNSGVTLDAQNDGLLSSAANDSTFTNQGTFKKSGGTGITEVQAKFESTGAIEIEDSNGTIKLSGGGSSSGAGNAVTVGTGAKLRIESQAFTFDGTGFDGAGTVELGGTTTTFKGAHGSGKVSLNGGNAAFDSSQSTLTSLELVSGTLSTDTNGSASVGSLAWKGGSLNGKVSAAGGSLTTGNKTIAGGDLTLTGNTAWDGSGIAASASAKIKTNSGVTFDAQNDGILSSAVNASTFTNQGTFKKTGGTGITEVQSKFESTGAIEVEDSNGTIKLSGGGSSSGAGNAVTVGSGAKLRIESQAFTFDGTGFDGAGTIELGGATTTFKGAHGSGKVSLNGGNAAFDSSQSTLTSLELISGTLSTDTNGSASVGSLVWKGGSLNGKVSAAGGSLTTGNKTIAGGDLTLAGNTTWDGSGIAASASAKIKTNSGVTLDAQNDGLLSSAANDSTFTNQGTLKKSGGTGIAEIQAKFESTGAIEVEDSNGTIKLSGGGSSSGAGNAVTVGTGAKLRIESQAFTFDGTGFDGAGTVELRGATTTFKGAHGSGKISLNGGNAAFDSSQSTLASLELVSGTLSTDTNGSASVGSLAWKGGSLNGKVSAGGGSLTTGNKTIAGGDLTLMGNTAWDGSGIAASASAKIKTNSGVTFDAQNDGILSSAVNASTFTNQGTLKKSGGTGITEVQAKFESTGAIEVEENNGTIKLSGGGSSSGAGNAVTVGSGAKLRIESQAFTFDGTGFDGTGTVELGGATTTFKGAHGSGKVSLNGGNAAFDSSQSTLASLELVSGTLSTDTNGSASVGSLTWKGGSLNGKVSAGGGSLTTGNKTIAGGDLTLTGNTAWDGSGIAASASAKIKTNSGVTFDAQNDGILSSAVNASTFTNQGTLKKSGGTGITEVQAKFESTGAIEVEENNGTIKLSGGGSSSGTVTLGNSGKVRIEGQAFAFTGGSINGASGQLELAGGTTTFSNNTGGDAEIAIVGGTGSFNGNHAGTGKLKMSGGIANGSGSATFATIEWTGGEVANTTLNTAGGTIGGGGNKKLNHGARLNLSGTTEWQADNLATDNGAEIANSGTFNIAFDGTLSHGGGAARGKFKNNGTLNKDGDADDRTEIQTIFENAHTVNVNSGKLRLAGSGKNADHAKIDVDAGAALEIDGDFSLEALSELKGNGLARLLNGLLDAAGTIDVATFDFDGGQLKGSNKFMGTVNWNNGHWSSSTNDYTTTIDVGATLHLRNGNGHGFDRRDIVNHGTIDWHAGDITSAGGSLLNSSVFNDKHGGSHAMSDGTASFTNNGTYNKTGNGTTSIAMPFVNNNGVVNVTHGTLHFVSSFQQTAGTLVIASGATAQFDEDLNFDAGTLTGSGTIMGDVINAGLLSPGSSPGTFTIAGDLTLLGTSVALFELGGTTAGTAYDSVGISGSVTLGGSLSLKFVNDFHTTVLPGNTFTVLTATSLTGAFNNVANGQRLDVFGGLGSFQVNYGTNSAFAANSVVLSNFAPVPEPSTWAMFISGLGIVAVLGYRRRRAGK